MNVNWFPGHMTKARRMIEAQLKWVDAVCEIVDARLPLSSHNPDFAEITEHKPRLLILNRMDLSEEFATAGWLRHFERQGIIALAVDAQSGTGIARFGPSLRRLLAEKIQRFQDIGQTGRVLRVMVLGIPNVGKSSLINRLAGRRAATVEDRPGVTRNRQWVHIDDGFDLLDTPGVLWPKIHNPRQGLLLAYSGAIRDEVLDSETLASYFLYDFAKTHPEALVGRYGLDLTRAGAVADSEEEETMSLMREDGLSQEALIQGLRLLKQAARNRGFLLSGGVPDTERMALKLLDEFRNGKLGRFTLEEPPETQPEIRS